jgi:hypothetical protein
MALSLKGVMSIEIDLAESGLIQKACIKGIGAKICSEFCAAPRCPLIGSL